MKSNILGKIKILIATPMYGGQSTLHYTLSVGNLMLEAGRRGINVALSAAGNESLITKARNNFANFFINSDFDYLFFIDSDIGFHYEDFFTVVETAIKNPQIDIITASYPMKSINWESVKIAIENNLSGSLEDLQNFSGTQTVYTDKEKFDIQKPVEVLDAGAGFMLVSKKLLKDFVEFYPEQKYTQDGKPTVAFFQDGIKDGEFYSEDYMFCSMVRDMGRKIWLLPWINLTHTGSYVFRGNFQNSARIQYIRNQKNKGE